MDDNDYDFEDVEQAAWDAAWDPECEATDGCIVEPDGYCEHGCPSILIAEGMI